MIEKIISGGQTGVDRAGLDAAMETGIPVGGYCPRGRLAEDGTVPERYPLIEINSERYASRTEKNVVESDGTLVLNIGALSDGTKATVDFAKEHKRPYLVLQLDGTLSLQDCRNWIREHGIRTLNVAGPRESKHPGIHLQALVFLRPLFHCQGTD
jgi:predicted Rossmann-fold nucleotide-binding protein